MTHVVFTTVEDAVKIIVEEYIHNNDVTFGEFISSISVDGASVEDVVEIYNKVRYEVDGIGTDSLTVKVNGGHIVATVSPDPDYPGIDVEYVADNDIGEYLSRPRVLFEKPLDADNVRALIWADKNQEDYTDDFEFNE